jgi:ferrous iron transport protein B
MECSQCRPAEQKDKRRRLRGYENVEPIRIVLVGNPNVGRSVLFNQLTGAHQIIGNWPGKAADVMSGRLVFEGTLIELIDLPGAYSITSESVEDRRIRDFLMGQKLDAVINVVDSTLLERNLAFTLELLSLDIPIIVALNMIDRAEAQGLTIDSASVEEEIGVPVVQVSGLKGIGVTELLRHVLAMAKGYDRRPRRIFHTAPIEKAMTPLRDEVTATLRAPHANMTAERLLLGDKAAESSVSPGRSDIIKKAAMVREKLEREMEDGISSIIASDRYALAAGIVKDSTRRTGKDVTTLEERIHGVLTHRVYGLICLALIAGGSFFALFLIGDFFATMTVSWFNSLHPSFISLFGDPKLGEFFWGGVLGGLISVVSIVLPYLIPFFILLSLLEESGYISRAAFVMDNILHRIGLHGKAFFPLLLGYSCNVPACLGCRMLETERERVLAIFAVTLIPCAATSIVILGLVGTYIGIWWVIGLYLFNLAIVAVLTRIAYSILPGEPTALIMEMPPMRTPSAKLTLKQTWFRAKDFVVIAVPLLIVLGVILGALQYLGLFGAISDAMSPVTVWWLGLPAFAGILLIFGIMRKELTLLLLGTVAGTQNFGAVMTSDQMIVFTLVVMLYIPCIATIGALVKEIGMKRAAIITVFEIGLAILVGGIAFRLFSLF